MSEDPKKLTLEYKGYIGIGLIIATVIVSVLGQGNSNKSFIETQRNAAETMHKEQIKMLDEQQDKTSDLLTSMSNNLQLFKQEIDFKINEIRRDLGAIKEDISEQQEDAVTETQIRSFVQVYSSQNNLEYVDPVTLK